MSYAAGASRRGDHPTGWFYEPTILTGCTPEMDLMHEEIFGPVVGIMRVKDFDEAITRANDSAFGLGASVFTTSLDEAHEAAERLEAGMVWINNPMIDNDALPFGGWKTSGLGRELGRHGLDTFRRSKMVILDHNPPGRTGGIPIPTTGSSKLAGARCPETRRCRGWPALLRRRCCRCTPNASWLFMMWRVLAPFFGPWATANTQKEARLVDDQPEPDMGPCRAIDYRGLGDDHHLTGRFQRSARPCFGLRDPAFAQDILDPDGAVTGKRRDLRDGRDGDDFGASADPDRAARSAHIAGKRIGGCRGLFGHRHTG